MNCVVCGAPAAGSPCDGCRFEDPCTVPVKGFGLCTTHREEYDNDRMPLDVLEKILDGSGSITGVQMTPALGTA